MAIRRQGKAQRPTNAKLAPKKGSGIKPKVVLAERKDERVWNLTDSPATPGAGTTMSIAGKNVAPGHAVRVPKEMLEKSKRLAKLQEAGSIHVGAVPPEEYLAAKGKTKAVVSREHGRSHGHPEQRALFGLRKAAKKADAEADALEKAAAEAAAAVEKAKTDKADRATLEQLETVAKEAEASATAAREAANTAREAVKKKFDEHRGKMPKDDAPKDEVREERHRDRDRDRVEAAPKPAEPEPAPVGEPAEDPTTAVSGRRPRGGGGNR